MRTLPDLALPDLALPDLALAGAELKRVTRDRAFLFFVVVLPILVTLLVA